MSEAKSSAKRWRDVPRAAAFVGVAQLGIAITHGEWLPHLLLGFAFVTLVPLGVALGLEGSHRGTAGEREREEVPFGYRLVLLLLPGLVLGGFFVFSSLVGTLPSVMSAGIIGMFTGILALYGVQRVIRRGFSPRHELAVDLAYVLLPVGALWLFASRLGVPLLGFHEPTVLLTAEHFVHAGFGAPLLFGVLGRHVGESTRLRKVYGVATVFVCLAIPLTAIGIATSRVAEVPAALLLAAGMLVGAFCILAVARRALAKSPLAAGLLGLSGVSLGLSMVLAAVWAVTGHGGNQAVSGSALTTLEQMLQWQGAVNSFGFLAAGLIGLTLLEQADGR